MSREDSRAVGVDGCRQGWVAVTLVGGAFASAALVARLEELLADLPASAVVGVDMPIGLPAREPRAADLAARAALGPRRSSLFVVPPREVLLEEDFAKASALARRIFGRGISKQAHALRRKILEVEALAEPRLHEVHPELCFAVLAGEPLPHPKRSWAGQALRRALLERAGIRVPDDPGEAGAAAPDDVLDAAVAAWSAARIAAGTARRFPAQAPDQGDPAAIWA